MITEEPKLTVNAATTHRFLPLLLLLFVGSGCAALIYEIVWFQLLQLVIGSSAISLGVLLGTFMGGMCLGSLAFPRVISSGHHPLRVYGLIELGIGLLGVFVLFAMPYVGRLYMAYAGEGSMGILLRGIVCAVSLLPPTVLMGATLPAIARWVETSPQGISWLGFFYGGNIAGAVFGCLLAGFYLLRVHEMATATFVAAMINGVVGLIGLGLAALTSRDHAVADTSQPCRDLSSCESFIGNNRGSEAHTSKSEIQNPKSDIDQSLLTSAPTDGSSEPAPAEAPPTTPLKRGTGAEPGNTGPAPADTAVELSGALASRHLPLPARNEWGEDRGEGQSNKDGAPLPVALLPGQGGEGEIRALSSPSITISTAPGDGRGLGSWTVYAAIALSGLCALGAEVIWTRLLSLLLGGTVYTFSIILGVFLTGLGIGSSLGSFGSRETTRPRLAFGGCQMLLCAAIAWAAWMLSKSLPYWPVNPSLATSPWFTFQLDLVRCAWAVLPPAILWGASFPLALASVAARGQDPGRLVGGVYAANTVGAIVGAISFSVLMVAWLGTQQAQRVLIGLSALAGLLVLAPFLWAARDAASQAGRAAEEIMPPAESPIVNHQSQTDPSRAASATASFAWEFAGGVMLTVALGVASWLAWSVPQVPSGLIAYGRYLATRDSGSTILYMGEGMNASVAVSELDNGVRNFHVSGKVEASTEPQDMRLQRMLGHIPALLHRKPRSVLIVGCGAGVTAGSFVLHPDVERIVICEIEPLIPRVVALYFDSQNYSVLKDPRVRVVYDDARHYILRTDEKFDIITSDPIHPWVKGAATLYTKEYFDLCKRHLNPGGLVTQWVPLYESNLDVVKSEIATFFEVFPHGTIWGNDQGGEGYDTVLLGQAEPIQIHVDGLQRRLDRKDHAQVARSLEDVAFKSAVDLLSTYAGQGPDLVQWLKDAEINRDRNLRLQYLAGLGLNSDRSASIYDDMLAHRRFPEELFQASSVLKQVLRKAIEPTPTAK